MAFLRSIQDRYSVITPIEYGVPFPEKMYLLLDKYREDINLFKELVLVSNSSAELLEKIRDSGYGGDKRMSLLKLFRRCVCLVCDTETTKKIRKHPTAELVKNYGHTFKPIKILQNNFRNLTREEEAALAVLIGEYDDRGIHGYILTDLFFSWFEAKFPNFVIDGPRGAGSDIELSSIFPDFSGEYPCDFVIKDENDKVLAVGFARYDSTRGGAQSDDRTGGNETKVLKAAEYVKATGNQFRIIFVADGPGLAHNDTWEAACQLDDSWDGNVRVTTLSLSDERITAEWLIGQDLISDVNTVNPGLS